ncbi:MAG: RNA polymerase factor sigma-54 [Treponema sp.]|jgi:RNA polymerase sigma-54 factor|nr:RNA polymerase factor sigma-54 [Treponema sp.]
MLQWLIVQLRPALIQEQRLKLSPQLIQAVKLMELPLLDLRGRIQEELEQNPALELVEDKSLVSLEGAVKPVKEEEEYFETSSDPGFSHRRGMEASDERQRFIEGVLTRSETLQEHLLWQLQLEPIDQELFQICQTLIQNLDSDGFHKEPVETLFKEPSPRIEEAIALVRSLEPQGTCCSGYLESLRVQIGLLSGAPPGIEEVLDHLEALYKGKIAEVAKKLGRTEEDLYFCLDRIKELSPFPGRQCASGEVRYVIPDVQVIRREGELVIIMNEEEIPVLGINRYFRKLAGKTGRSEKEIRDFARKNIYDAQVFISSVSYRNQTLLRVSQAVTIFQRDFFIRGPKYLAPLTLRDIAQELEINETTVSRTARGKYMQTEWGIFEIRHFFTNSISGAGSGGSQHSKGGVKETIREIIDSEKGKLSDQKIVELLAKRGISLARRTVAKYRRELDLGSSYER